MKNRLKKKAFIGLVENIATSERIAVELRKQVKGWKHASVLIKVACGSDWQILHVEIKNANRSDPLSRELRQCIAAGHFEVI